MNRIDQAARLFTEGYSCSQAVFAPFAPDYDISHAEALRLSAGLGGGLRAGSACGAAVGALLVLGLDRCDQECSKESRHEVMRAVESFNERFSERAGGFECPAVLGHDVRCPDERALVQEQGLRESRCLPAVRAAAEILEELLAEA